MNTQSKKSVRFTGNRALVGVAAAIVLTAGALAGGRFTAEAADIVVYKSPTCGCCSAWIDHLERSGFTVESHNRNDMGAVKDQLKVPGTLRSCHTAKAGDYVIEGHVPADDIARLLKERPAVKGLAVAGMPMGSPGMEGPRKDRYQVTAFGDDGATSVYARH